jgi:hypothetical protein
MMTWSRRVTAFFPAPLRTVQARGAACPSRSCGMAMLAGDQERRRGFCSNGNGSATARGSAAFRIDMIDIAFVGGVMLWRGVDRELERVAPGSRTRVPGATAPTRRAGADLVVFSNRSGPNMRLHPTARFREFARAVIDLGADVYYGHSARVFQGVEIHRGKPIPCDTGDFVDDYAIDRELRNDWSFVFRIVLDGRSLRRITLFPVALAHARSGRAQGRQRAAIPERMERLSAEMGRVSSELTTGWSANRRPARRVDEHQDAARAAE